MTLTDELGDTPPPSHAWTAPVVEDMLWEVKAGLMEAVVIDPGRAILFYGRHSMGEGLKVDKARDAAFLLIGAGTWVGKSAYLTTDPMTLQEGKRAITQAVSDHRVKTEGPGAHGRERVGTEPPQSYKVALQAAHQKALETAEALCDDLERLDDEHRERSRACSQSRS